MRCSPLICTKPREFSCHLNHVNLRMVRGVDAQGLLRAHHVQTMCRFIKGPQERRTRLCKPLCQSRFSRCGTLSCCATHQRELRSSEPMPYSLPASGSHLPSTYLSRIFSLHFLPAANFRN